MCNVKLHIKDKKEAGPGSNFWPKSQWIRKTSDIPRITIRVHQDY